MALWQRDRDQHPVQSRELIHYSDAGSQYTSFRLASHLEAVGIAASIGSVGDAYDNALIESTIDLFKTELIKPAAMEDAVRRRARHRRVRRLVQPSATPR
jgi:putative transposase